MTINKSLLTGSATLLILKLLEDKDMYGYQMIEELAKRSDNTFLQQSNKVKEYLKTVCEQIRWKKAHAVLSQEIEWSIIILTTIMLCIELDIRVFLTYNVDMSSRLISSLINILIGIGCMTLVYFLDFIFIGRHAKIIYFGILIAIIVALYRSGIWYGKTPYVHLIMMLIPTAFAGLIYSMRTKGYLGIILCEVCFVPAVLVGLLSQRFTSILLVSLICLILLTFAVAKGWFNVRKLSGILMIYIPTVIATAATLFITLFDHPYRWDLLMTLINPARDPKGLGYIGTIIRKYIDGAKFVGVGQLGINNNIKLPESDTDFLLTYIIHRFGWITFIIIMTVLSVFLLRIFTLALKQKNVLDRLLITAIFLNLTLQIVLYVVNNLGFRLLEPLTLPLISYSGTSMVVNMTFIGIMLSVFNSGNLVRDPLSISKRRRNKFIEIVDGKIIIDFSTK